KVDIVRTPARDEAARLAREGAADGYRTIVAVGGDGTANEIANGLVGSGAVLALYPIGSGNDLARALGYPRRRRDVLKFLRVAPDAVMDDGQLDVLLAGDLSRAASLVALAKLYRGTHIDGRTIVLRRARVVEIELERPLAMELDGEVSSQSRLSIRIRPRAL